MKKTLQLTLFKSTLTALSLQANVFTDTFDSTKKESKKGS